MIRTAFSKRRAKIEAALAHARFSLDEQDDTSEQELKRCPRCKGRGVVDLLITSPKCQKCGGTGKVPADLEDD